MPQADAEEHAAPPLLHLLPLGRIHMSAAAANETSRTASGVESSKKKSKAHNASVAVRSDAVKCRSKYRDLKRKVADMEAENDRMHAKALVLKRKIQRVRLERT